MPEDHIIAIDTISERLDALQAQIQQVAQFPQLGVNVEQGGATFYMTLSSHLTIAQSVPADTMNAICAKWLDEHEDVKRNLLASWLEQERSKKAALQVIQGGKS